MILLDTDVLIEVFNRSPAALAWIASLGTEPLAVPGFVAMEVIQGCGDKRHLAITQAELRRFTVLWPSEHASDAAVDTFARYHLSHSLGLLDALIAHTAIEHGLPLHTFNVKHFGAVPDLTTVRPYARP
jgi:predicted nucleic acid-binding protein